MEGVEEVLLCRFLITLNLLLLGFFLFVPLKVDKGIQARTKPDRDTVGFVHLPTLRCAIYFRLPDGYTRYLAVLAESTAGLHGRTHDWPFVRKLSRTDTRC